MNRSKPVTALLEKGVTLLRPETVDIGEDVQLDQISCRNVVLYPGVRIYGCETVLSPGVQLGREGPVIVENCQLGRSCELKAGYFSSSAFLDGCVVNGGAHVREGCLLEEETKAGHTVGLKQTILFPYVTLGSLINFCDCLMAGGTGRKNHSEVGSGYVHFNFTPQQDKATASLIGDVPRGVMLRERPIFLGGQGGLVGPSRIGYGTVIAAGVVYREDCPEGNVLITGATGKASRKGEYRPGMYGDIRRRLDNNLAYLANLLALKQWYIHVRRPFYQGDKTAGTVYGGAMQVLEEAFRERLKRLDELAERMEGSLLQVERFIKGPEREKIMREQRRFMERWPVIRQYLAANPEASLGVEERRLFLEQCGETAGREGGYLSTIRALAPGAVVLGERWLAHIVLGITDLSRSILTGEKSGNEDCL